MACQETFAHHGHSKFPSAKLSKYFSEMTHSLSYLRWVIHLPDEDSYGAVMADAADKQFTISVSTRFARAHILKLTYVYTNRFLID